MNWETLIGIVGCLGGFEAVKFIINRKQNRRIAEAEADDSELNTVRGTVQFLQDQLQQKEERFADQTERLRATQSDLFAERELRHKKELELMQKRCEVRHCPNREPQNGY